jgi:hypothetical protein
MFKFKITGLHIEENHIISSDRIEQIINDLYLLGVNNLLIGNKDIDNEQVYYAPIPLEGLLLSLLPKVESIVGKSLLPVYSFLWIYKRDGQIPRHVDKKSLDYVVTLNLASSSDDEWPLKVCVDDSVVDVNLKQGQYAIMEGKRLEHWRDKCPVEWRMQATFMYIHKDSNKLEYFLDGRDFLGAPPIPEVITSPARVVQIDIDAGPNKALYTRASQC